MTVLAWFLWRRWQFARQAREWVNPSGMLFFCHNSDWYGCRKHPVIYDDMCCIVWGMK